MKRLLSLALVLAVVFLTCCTGFSLAEGARPTFQTYKDIPGVTGEETAALDALLLSKPRLAYGVSVSTEAFIHDDGTIGGFAARLCSRLTELFGFAFDFYPCDWEELNEGIVSKQIDLVADFSPTPERLQKFLMTTPIIHRTIKVFTLAKAEALSVTAKARPIRCAFMSGSTTYEIVAESWNMPFEPVFVQDQGDVPGMLSSGEVDAFIEEGTLQASFDAYDFIVAQDYYPLTYSPVSLTSGNEQLAPLMSVMQKYLDNGGYYELTQMYNQGFADYLTHKLAMKLTDAEKDYIAAHNTQDTAISIACETSNYQTSFYNVQEKEFQGVAIDVLKEVSALTGLVFEVGNKTDAEWSELLQGLENGKYALISELMQTTNRQNRFLWADTPYYTDDYALLSGASYPDVDINQVVFAKVGLIEDTAYKEVFLEWFPDHPNTVSFVSTNDAFAALEKGDIDLLMATQSSLLHLTNYLEKPHFKAAIVFDYASDSYLGFNKNEEILRSIVNKAMGSIDMQKISESWKRKVFDYNSKLLKDVFPYLVLIVIILVLGLFTVFTLLIRNRQISKNLEKLVAERTSELSLHTSTLSTMFASMPDMVFCKDLDLRFTRCNASFEKHFGCKQAEIIGKDDMSATKLSIPAELAEQYRAADMEVINEKRTITVEEIIPTYEGVPLLFETIKTPLMQGDTPIGIMGMSRDITQRKASEEMLNLTLDNLDTCIYINEIETGEILFINKKMLQTFGRGQLNGRVCWEVLQDGFTQRCSFCPIPKLLETGDEYCVWEEHNTVTGRYYKNTDSLIKWQDGRLVHMQHSVDITESVELQQKLIGALSKLEAVVSNYSGIIWSVDVKKEFTLFDGTGVKLLAVDPTTLIGRPIQNAVGCAPIDLECIENTFTQGPQSWTSELNGTIFSSNAIPLKDENGMTVAVVGTSYDVTESIKLQHDLEQASKGKSDFLSRMSHEIRTPLNAILGMIGIAKHSNDLPKILHCLNRAESASKHLLGIINDILDMSKIEADKFELSNHEFDFEKALMNIANVTNFRADEKQQNLVVNLGTDVPSFIVSDELRLTQVLTNLLTNAVKFTPEKGTIALYIEKIQEESDGITLRFQVQDNGIGISEEQQSRLFTSFEQADGSISRKFGGTGLGLAISKRIVTLMGGRIWIESKLGQGSNFIFEIKVKEGKEKSRSGLSDKINRANIRILAVDDCEPIRDYFTYVMAAHHLPCDVAADGWEALSLIQNSGDRPYNMFFVDWQMPEMNGIELTKKIKEITKGNSVVVMISISEWGTIEEAALSAGVERFIAKPLFPSALINVINEVLGAETQKPKAIKRDAPLRHHRYKDHSILIAEDVEVNREIMSAVLEETGIAIDFAFDGIEAVAMFEKHPDKYSLILMDIHMPLMDGFEATRRIRALAAAYAKTVPIIAMTANVFREDVENCLAAGMNDHIGKPIDIDNLFAKFAQYLPAKHGAEPAPVVAAPVSGTAPVADTSSEPAINVAEGLGRLMNNKALYFKMLGRFEARPMADAILAGSKQGDMLKTAQAAHALKGVAANLGLAQIASVAAQIEAQAKGGAVESDMPGKLNSAVDAVTDAIARLLKEEG